MALPLPSLPQISGMTAAKARALHAAGLTDADSLAAAPEDKVAAALAPALIRNAAGSSKGNSKGSSKGGSGAGQGKAGAKKQLSVRAARCCEVYHACSLVWRLKSRMLAVCIGLNSCHNAAPACRYHAMLPTSQVGLTGSTATNQLVSRAAKSAQAAAQVFVTEAAAAAAAELAELEQEEAAEADEGDFMLTAPG